MIGAVSHRAPQIPVPRLRIRPTMNMTEWKTMQYLADNPSEEALHQVAIEELAQEVHQPVANVKAIYESEYARLKCEAKIMDYVPLFASRRAREALRRRA